MNPFASYMFWVKIIGVLAVCAACASGGGYVVYDHLTAKYDAEKLQMQEDQHAAIQKRISDNEAALANQQNSHAKEIQRYEDQHTKDLNQISANRAFIAAGGLRMSKSVCGGFATTTKATDAGQSNGADQSTFELPSGIETGLLNLATRADTETSELENKLGMCQQFARDNGFAPTVGSEK